LGLKAVNELKAALPDRKSLAAVALQWILQFEDVSCVIPGASSAEQVASNLSVFEEAPLTYEEIAAINAVYQKYIQKEVHHLW
jgi:aryl-alcohol dehydrogenase-like predicted oxidoreductase